MKQILVALFTLALLIGCSSKNPNDPKMLLADLDNPRKQDAALSKIENMQLEGGKFIMTVSSDKGDKKIEVAAADAQQILDKLITILKDDNNKVAKKAIRAIIKIGDEKKIVEAAKIAVSSKHRSVSTQGIRSVERLKNKTDEVLDLIVEAINADEQFAREAAIMVAGNLKIKKAVKPLIKTLLDAGKNQHIVLNKQAAISLGKIGDESAIYPLIKGLYITKNFRMKQGTRTIANRGSAFVVSRNALIAFGKPALEAVVKTIKKENKDFQEWKKSNPKLKQADVDYNMLVMIGELGSKDHYDIIKGYFEHEDKGVRTFAISLVAKLNITGAVGELVKRYKKLKKLVSKEQDPQKMPDMVSEMQTINRILAQLGTKGAHKHVMNEAFKGDLKIDGETFPDLRADAIASLANFADHTYYDDYKKLLGKEKDAEIKKSIEKDVMPLMEIADKCKADTKCYAGIFKTYKGKKKSPMRQKATYMFYKYYDQTAKETLFKKAIVDKDLGVRKAAVDVLERMGTKKDLPRLEEVINKAKKKSYLKKSIGTFKMLKAKLKNRS